VVAVRCISDTRRRIASSRRRFDLFSDCASKVVGIGLMGMGMEMGVTTLTAATLTAAGLNGTLELKSSSKGLFVKFDASIVGAVRSSRNSVIL